jgi:hypothetical protein
VKKILYLTFYYEPDLSAGSFRNSSLSKDLAKQLDGKGHVEVITTQPNRYASYKEFATKWENHGNLTINRITVAPHKNGFIDQINTFRSYYKGVKRLIKNKHYDLVFVSSSRLFSAYMGSKIAKQCGCPLYLDIRDLFAENMKEIIRNPFVKYPLFCVLRHIEKVTFSSAQHINLVSEGFKTNFKLYKQANYTFYPNGIDDIFLDLKQHEDIAHKEPKTIIYAGNIGEGQGLHKILIDAAKQLAGKYHFRIIGDGGTKHLIEDAITKENISNIELLPPVNREKLLEEYKNAHFLFLHLNTYKAFEKVLPSKLFEYGATNIPIIAGVSGFANEFIKLNLQNTILFNPCDADDMVKKLKNYVYLTEERKYFTEKFRRDNISNALTVSILSYLI